MAYRILKILFVEVLILAGCLMIWPITLGIITADGDGYLPNISYVLTRLIVSLIAPGFTWPTILGLILSPYIALQTIRAYRWSKRSIAGRKWANLYFSILFLIAASWFGYWAWDLFYFMYALGDMPGEIVQFMELEGAGVLLCVLSSIMAVVCFLKFLDPTRDLID